MTDEQTEILKEILAELRQTNKELKEIRGSIKSVDNSIAIYSH